MAGPLAFQFLYGTAIRTGYITYPNGCTTGSEGTILQTAFEGESPTPLRITSFSHGGSYWFVLAASDGEPYDRVLYPYNRTRRGRRGGKCCCTI